MPQKRLIVTSELTIAELLAPTSRPGVMSIEDRKRVVLPLALEQDQVVNFVSISREVFLYSMVLRSAYLQRLPDAIHIATALTSGCRFFMSSDKDARRTPDELTWLTQSQHGVEILLKAAGV